MASEQPQSFWLRHEFLIRRLHSLSGLIPVGAYMCIHLLTNASILNSAATFQNAVFQIHSLGKVLWIVEWVFIFIPILFHAIVGVAIVFGGQSNTSSYRYGSNYRYTLQRISGMIAFLFIMWHVFHMHGWIHADWWINSVAYNLDGANFKPYNAASSGGEAMQVSLVIPILYAIGVLASVFHLANGIWTMGITWGVWVSPQAQKTATKLCAGFGVILAVIGLSAIWGFQTLDTDAARNKENQMYDAKVEAGEVIADPHKRSEGDEVGNETALNDEHEKDD